MRNLLTVKPVTKNGGIQSFRRYSRESDIFLSFRQNAVKAKIMDYSMIGIKSALFDETDIAAGTRTSMQLLIKKF